jgi:hypothetical protein
MISDDLLIKLLKLNLANKLYVVQMLVSSLAQEEAELIKPGQSYPVWSPYDAFDAASIMLEALQA